MNWVRVHPSFSTAPGTTGTLRKATGTFRGKKRCKTFNRSGKWGQSVLNPPQRWGKTSPSIPPPPPHPTHTKLYILKSWLIFFACTILIILLFIYLVTVCTKKKVLLKQQLYWFHWGKCCCHLADNQWSHVCSRQFKANRIYQVLTSSLWCCSSRTWCYAAGWQSISC